jgi:hypothetical protein
VLDVRGNRGPTRSDDQIPLPMPRDPAIRRTSSTFAKDNVGGDMTPRLVLRPRPRLLPRTAGRQTCHQFPLERRKPLDEQGLVDCFVADVQASPSGNSILSRLDICGGLHAIAHRLSCRCGLFSPFRPGVSGPVTTALSSRWTLPTGRS